MLEAIPISSKKTQPWDGKGSHESASLHKPSASGKTIAVHGSGPAIHGLRMMCQRNSLAEYFTR
jgi:hypothetical protein